MVNSRADECYDAAMELRSAFLALEGNTLAELDRDKGALGSYLEALVGARAAYHAPGTWLGPLEYVLPEHDRDALRRRLLGDKPQL